MSFSLWWHFVVFFVWVQIYYNSNIGILMAGQGAEDQRLDGVNLTLVPLMPSNHTPALPYPQSG